MQSSLENYLKSFILWVVRAMQADLYVFAIMTEPLMQKLNFVVVSFGGGFLIYAIKFGNIIFHNCSIFLEHKLNQNYLLKDPNLHHLKEYITFF